MKLAVIAGYIYPSTLPLVQAAEYHETTEEIAEFLLSQWNGEKGEPTAYKVGGGSAVITAPLRDTLQEALALHPGHIAATAVVAEYGRREAEASARTLSALAADPTPQPTRPEAAAQGAEVGGAG